MYSTYDKLGVKPNQNTDQYSVLELKSQQERIQLIQSTKIVCVDIYADWCGPCIQTAPAYSVLATKYNKAGMCAMVKLNWNNISQEERTAINGIPLFLFYVNGEVDNNYSVIGADLQQVENNLKKILENESNNPNNNKGPQPGRNTIRPGKQSGQQSFDDNQFTAQQDSYIPQQPNVGMNHEMYQRGIPRAVPPVQQGYMGPRVQQGPQGPQGPQGQQWPQGQQQVPQVPQGRQGQQGQQQGQQGERFQRGAPMNGEMYNQGPFRQQNVQYHQ